MSSRELFNDITTVYIKDNHVLKYIDKHVPKHHQCKYIYKYIPKRNQEKFNPYCNHLYAKRKYDLYMRFEKDKAYLCNKIRKKFFDDFILLIDILVEPNCYIVYLETFN